VYQDGATLHTARIVLEWLADKFGEHFMSLRSHIEWPTHSPDLNSPWGYLKDRVYSLPPQDTSASKNGYNIYRNFREDRKKETSDRESR
jgi:hypothetical protein